MRSMGTEDGSFNVLQSRCRVLLCGMRSEGHRVHTTVAANLTRRPSARPALSDIQRRQCVRASALTGIDPGSGFEYPITMEIKRAQKAHLVPNDRRIDTAQRRLLHEEGNLQRFIVGPKANAMLRMVVTTGWVGEIQRHGNYHRLTSSPCPIYLQRPQTDPRIILKRSVQNRVASLRRYPSAERLRMLRQNGADEPIIRHKS